MPASLPHFKTARAEADYQASYDAALARWPQPVETLEVSDRFGCTHIHAAGPMDARPLVLVHGYGFTSTMWAPNVAALSQVRRVYAPDVLGDMGRSAPARMPGSGVEYGEWLAGVLDQLGIERADVGGLSYGGWIAANLASYRPERVAKLILMDPAATFLPLVMQFMLRAILAMALPGYGATYSYVRWMTSRRSALGRSDLSLDPCARAFAIAFKGWTNGGAGTYPAVLTDDELRRIKAPTLLMMGEDEVIYNPTRAIARARALIEGLRVEVIPNAGHSISMEQPEIVNAHIVRFLS